ncbi:MAG: hypothetical protein ABLQ96_02090 [Candidatus Acidiferrum sp.]
MKNSMVLTITSLLSILFLTVHQADDIIRGYSPGGVANMVAIAIIVVWLYAALLLAEQRSGYVISLLFSLLASGVPVIHMTGLGLGKARSAGATFFVWTLLALGLTSIFGVILSVRGLRSLRRESRSSNNPTREGSA